MWIAAHNYHLECVKYLYCVAPILVTIRRRLWPQHELSIHTVLHLYDSGVDGPAGLLVKCEKKGYIIFVFQAM